MNYILVSTIAYILNGLSVLTNKFLLNKSIPHPISYVFYISASSLIALVILPWTHIPDLNIFFILSVSTIAWTIGIYYMFSALKIGLADRVAPVIGILTPVFLIIYYFVFTQIISLNQVWGAGFSVFGLFLIILPYLHDHLKKAASKDRTEELVFELLAGLFFAISYILLKIAYNSTDFLTGLVWSKLILIPLLIIILIIPDLKKLVFSSQQDKINFLSKTGFLFIFSQVTGGVSQFMITFAISIANPALVNSLQGVQYAFLFIASFILFKKFPTIFNEKSSVKVTILKVIGFLFICFGLYILGFANAGPKNATLGITYSPRYAQTLGLDPKMTYIQILQDLSPSAVRLPIYWDQIMPQIKQTDFSDTDYYINQATQYHTKLTLAIGYKVPRYPECYIPNWVKGLSQQDFNTALYDEITLIVNRYKNSPSLYYWQVENEVLFPFGNCPSTDWSRLQKEVDLVHKLDPKHPVIITESGEYGIWLTSAKLGDIVGTSLYRRTLAPYITWFKSPLPPFYYQFKTSLVNLFYPGKQVFVSELQEEPWTDQPIQTLPFKDQALAFPLGDLQENVAFAKEAGFNEIYLWGVEWWYYLAKTGHPEYLQQATLIFKDIN